jgi:hypothetical protein
MDSADDTWLVMLNNPLVGLATIRRMGVVCAKAHLMVLAMFAVEGLLVVFTAMGVLASGLLALAPVSALILAVPLALVGFYVNMVIACILGRALFKTSHRLEIPLA